MSTRSISCTLLMVGSVFGNVPGASADPTGTSYLMTLDGMTTLQVEGHQATLTFGPPDPEILINDEIPDPPQLPGNPLNVTEKYDDGSVTFWIETQSTDGSVDIFNNVVTGVLFSIVDLHWGGEQAATLGFNELFGAFDNNGAEPADVFYTDLQIFGSGTILDPFSIFMQLDPMVFNQDLSELHVSFQVSHIPVPATLPLFSSCLVGLGLVRGRKARAGQDRRA
jgi:hypothetical protein